MHKSANDIVMYTDFFLHGDQFHIRGYDNNGERVSTWYKPSFNLYVPCDPPHATYHSIEGTPLAPVQFSGAKEARKFAEHHRDVYGFARFPYTEIDRLFPGSDLEYKREWLRFGYFDIETASDGSFPNVAKADQPINVVTISDGYDYFVYALDNVDIEAKVFEEIDVPRERIHVTVSPTENDLLVRFIARWQDMDMDVITGWNCQMFDIPYCVNRITRICGSEVAVRLSPFHRISSQTITVFNKEHTIYEICGIATLDYLDIYKKYKGKMQESYKLDYISHIELGTQKLEYDGPMHMLYQTDFTRWTAYNIQDVYLLVALEEKLKYLDLAVQIAYMTKVRYPDVFRSVRIWDMMTNNYLVNEKRVQGPFKGSNEQKTASYAGAYVRDPDVGYHQWIASFDLASLYPSLIIQYNIGPETLIDSSHELTPEDVIEQTPAYHQAAATADRVNGTLTATGAIYSKEEQSFLSVIMDRLFQSRKQAKRLKLEAENELARIDAELATR